MQQVSQIKNFLEVDKKIATAGQPCLRELETLADAGYQTIINLGMEDSDYALNDEKVWVEQLGMKYFHIPVELQGPKIADFIRFLNTMNLQQHKKLFIHCEDNKRVSVFVALYLVISNDISLTKGWNLILEVWEPNLVWESYYYDALNQFYRIKQEVE